jgi:hypothetical protein
VWIVMLGGVLCLNASSKFTFRNIICAIAFCVVVINLHKTISV